MNAAVDIVPLSPRVKSFIGQPHKVLIDGRWQSARDEETFEVFNPATEEVIARIGIENYCQSQIGKGREP